MSTFNAFDAKPQGRLSVKKVRAYADKLNAELEKQGAKRFIEIGRRYDYYAVDEIGVGDKSGSSEIARTFATGLTARQCVDSAQELYRDSLKEVSV